MTGRSKSRAEEFMDLVGAGDRAARADFLLTTYNVAMDKCHTTSEFGIFMAGVHIGFLNVHTLTKNGYPIQFEDTSRSKEMSGNEVIVDVVTKSWYRLFKKWREDEVKTERELPEEFEEFKKLLVAVLRSVDKERN